MKLLLTTLFIHAAPAASWSLTTALAASAEHTAPPKSWLSREALGWKPTAPEPRPVNTAQPTFRDVASLFLRWYFEQGGARSVLLNVSFGVGVILLLYSASLFLQLRALRKHDSPDDIKESNTYMRQRMIQHTKEVGAGFVPVFLLFRVRQVLGLVGFDVSYTQFVMSVCSLYLVVANLAVIFDLGKLPGPPGWGKNTAALVGTVAALHSPMFGLRLGANVAVKELDRELFRLTGFAGAYSFINLTFRPTLSPGAANKQHRAVEERVRTIIILAALAWKVAHL